MINCKTAKAVVENYYGSHDVGESDPSNPAAGYYDHSVITVEKDGKPVNSKYRLLHNGKQVYAGKIIQGTSEKLSLLTTCDYDLELVEK